MRVIPRRFRLLALLLFVIGMATSCSGQPALLTCHPYRGRLIFQGKPLAGVMVVFYPADASAKAPSASGVTDSEGWFSLTTYDPDDGAPEGDYFVGASQAPSAVRRQSPIKKDKSADPDPLKGRYKDPKKSGLRQHVDKGNNEVDNIVLQ